MTRPASRGACEGKAPAAWRRGQCIVNVVEERGEFLNFVHYDPGAGGERFDFAAKEAGLAHQTYEFVIQQEVVPMRVWECLAQPGGLASSTGTEQQERAVRCR
jgi:hypothetical protein